MRPLPPWIAAFSALPGALFVYWGFRAVGQSLRMIDEINAVVVPENQVLYYGLGPILAWRAYERLFPDRTNLPRSLRKYAIRSAIAFTVTIGFMILLGALIP